MFFRKELRNQDSFSDLYIYNMLQFAHLIDL